MGAGEVESTLATEEFLTHPTDLITHLSWERLTAYQPLHPDYDEELVVSGLVAIANAIEKAKQEVYPDEGERGKVRGLFQQIERQVLPQVRPVPLDLWHGRDEVLRTKATTVTVKIKTALRSGSRENPMVVGVVTDGHFRLSLVATFRLTTGVKKHSPVGQWWRRDMQRPEFDLPGIGTFVRDASGYYERRFEVEGTQATVAPQVADLVVRVVEPVQAMLTQQGYPMLLDDLPEEWRRKNRRRAKQETGDVR